jgi:hypothetical protein
MLVLNFATYKRRSLPQDFPSAIFSAQGVMDAPLKIFQTEYGMALGTPCLRIPLAFCPGLQSIEASRGHLTFTRGQGEKAWILTLDSGPCHSSGV